MFVQSAGVGLQVATQMRGAVCCAIELSGGDELEPVFDPDDPVWVAVPDEEPLEAEPDPADEGVVGFFGGVALLDFLAVGGAAAGLDTKRDVPLAAGCFALGFDATFDGRAAVRLADDFGALDAALVALLEFEAAAVAPPADCEPLLAGAFAEDMSLLNGERIVRLVELDASGEAVPPCCVLGVAPDAASTPAARPARTAASETGSRIELNDESINCSSTKARTPHRNGLDPGWTVAVVSEFRTHSQSDSRADPRLRSPLRRSDAPSGISPPRKLKLSPSDKIG
jgi:hypothetical protein